jgi:hypothetical protein
VVALQDEKLLPVQPWQINPRWLISWWEMEQFSAKGFFLVGCLIEGVKTECLMGSTVVDPDQPIYNFAAPISEQAAARAKDYLPRIERECRSIGLRLSADTVKRAMERLEKRDQISINYQWLNDKLTDLKALICDEMKEHGFFYISPERGKFWTKADQKCLFGDAVANAFPAALFDIHGAGVCLAIGIGTPSVFHLMRVLEFGLAALGSIFNVSLAHTNWEPAIREIESKIREMHKDPAWRAKSDCKLVQENYSQVASHFAVLKDAWRNYTMHGRGRYGEDEAELIFLNVKGFMQKLAALGLKGTQ